MQPPAADLDTDRQPPLSLPFAHFVTGAVLLLVGGGIAGIGPLLLPIRASSAGTLHLLLAGWIALTIMGAMTQSVPVWSGRPLYSRRLSVASLWLVGLGLLGLVSVFFTGGYDLFPVPATVLLAGFWLFAATIWRSLPPLDALDITEAHFAFALGSLVLATLLGWLLAADIGYRVTGGLPIGPHGLLMTHLTLTVFGFVLVTVVGALYQLGPMFTQSQPTAVDRHLAHVEMVALPVGVALLAGGRLLGQTTLARVGGTLLVLGALAFAGFLLRRLVTARVETDPMLRRYWLVALSLVGWAVLTLPAWLAAPAAHFVRFGSGQATHLLFVGVFAFTIVGTFYHVVPFIVWFHQYGDRLGYEPVPMIGDLYDDRLARVEFWLLGVGLGVLWAGELLGLPVWVQFVGGNLLGVGVLCFGANMALVVWRHRPETLREILAVLRGKRPAAGSTQ
jgi:hypothetical protein